MVYLMPKSPKGSEHLYFNVVDRTDTSHQDAAKIDCVFMVYLGCENEGIFFHRKSHTVSKVFGKWGNMLRGCVSTK